MDFSKYIDHTILKADTTKEDIIKVCNLDERNSWSGFGG